MQVFGVNGGMTGVLARDLTRAGVGRALRARHTYALAGGHGAGLVRCGDHIQGDEFSHSGPAELTYRFFGSAPLDEVCAYDHTGLIWRRDLRKEAGYSGRRVRLRWGGARIKDRYRWAAWEGALDLTGATIEAVDALGFEHDEERIDHVSDTRVTFRSETYGDADAIEIDVDGLATAVFTIAGRIGGFTRAGDLSAPTPFADCPSFEWQVTGEELIRVGAVRRELGGVELFVALERIAEADMPREIAGSLSIIPENAAFGFRPVYFLARQRNDAKIWTSAQFIYFEDL